MDDTLSNYDESLEALERQRESLELVMQRMGEEWEESGAGIGWLKDSFYQTPTTNNTKVIKVNNNASSQAPNLTHLMQSVNTTGPSPDYLQKLLNVNDELVAQSLASLPSSSDTRDSSNGSSNSFLVTLMPVSPPLSEDDPIPPPTVLRKPQQQPSTPPVTPD